MEPLKKIILALDTADYEQAIESVHRFKEHIDIFKVGFELFTAVGPEILKEIHTTGKKVFLDLKFHDIPTTVSRAAMAAAYHGVYMINVHTLGGLEMMKRCAESLVKLALIENIPRPRLLGVTILTSIDQPVLRDELGFQMGIMAQVKHLANLARQAGLDGVIASPQEISLIRDKCGEHFLIVTPGIRPSWSKSHDQRRTMTPRQALRKGADYIVMGRSILEDPNPIHAIERIYEEITRLESS